MGLITATLKDGVAESQPLSPAPGSPEARGSHHWYPHWSPGWAVALPLCLREVLSTVLGQLQVPLTVGTVLSAPHLALQASSSFLTVSQSPKELTFGANFSTEEAMLCNSLTFQNILFLRKHLFFLPKNIFFKSCLIRVTKNIILFPHLGVVRERE